MLGEGPLAALTRLTLRLSYRSSEQHVLLHILLQAHPVEPLQPANERVGSISGSQEVAEVVHEAGCR